MRSEATAAMKLIVCGIWLREAELDAKSEHHWRGKKKLGIKAVVIFKHKSPQLLPPMF